MSPSFVLARYVGAAVFARLADEGARVSILLLVLERTGDPALGGILIAALMVPHVLAAPVVGAIADAVRGRRLLYATAYALYAGCLAAAAAMAGRSTLGAAIVLVLAGCVAPLLIGGLSSLLGQLVPDRLERAFGLDVMSYSVAGIAGPALAAVLAGLAGAAWSTVGLAALVLAAAAILITLPLPVATGPRRLASPLAAFALMARRPRLGAVTAGTVFSMAGFGALPLVAALIAADEHRPELTGVILSAGAAGGLIGSLLCTRWPIRRWRPEWVVAFCLLATALPFAILILLPGGWAGLPLFALAGGLGAPVSVAVFAVRDQESPPELRTQVFSLGAGLKVTAAAAGAAAAGLAAGAGAAVILAAIALCQLLGAASVVLVGRVTPTSPPPRSIVSQAN
ncbi:MFS transporter [Paractinoplanes abujensis]|uniref:MFS family permease n=1 Tax=Paractinoplanes abujensis TaxID=882441 RepID=A0A7W7G8N2_9ACTN|nr:MFS transporter [Actinoplanes abujensis]MBB4698126.1 MFS family permease [Actinoplanes abujensis]